MRLTGYYVTYGTELLFGPCVDQETVTLLLAPIHQLDRTLDFGKFGTTSITTNGEFPLGTFNQHFDKC